MVKEKNSIAVDHPRRPWTKNRILKTVALFGAFCGLGLATSLLGPTLVSMEILLDTDTKSISAAFTGSSLGYLAGAILCGFIYSMMNKELLFSVALIDIGVTTALAPWSPHLYIFVAFFVVQCVGMGIVDTASQAYVLKLWEGHKLKQPMMQTLHGCFSLGATVSPFIVKLFLVDISEMSRQSEEGSLNETDSANKLNATIDMEWINDSGLNSTVIPYKCTTETDDLKARVGFVCLAYVVIASLIFAASILFIILFFMAKPSCQDHNNQEKNKEDKDNSEHMKTDKIFRIRLLVITFFFFFIYSWVKGTPGSFLAAFVVKELEWPNNYGALITATYWGSHFASRVLGIPISAVMKPLTMLTMDLIITSSGFGILLFVHYHDSLMWVGVVLAGLGMGTIFATTILWLEDHMEITGAASSVVFVAASAGDMTAPLLTGFLFNDYSHMWFTYIILSASLVLILAFISAYFYIRHYGSRTPSWNISMKEVNSVEVNSPEVESLDLKNSAELRPSNDGNVEFDNDEQNPHNPFLQACENDLEINKNYPKIIQNYPDASFSHSSMMSQCSDEYQDQHIYHSKQTVSRSNKSKKK